MYQNRIRTALNSYLARNSKGTEKMVIGHFEFMRHGNKVWIRNLRTGEAGEFPVDEIAAIYDKFFAERF